MEAKTFILGKDEVPQWFNDSAKQGRAKLVYDEDQVNLVGATIYTLTKVVSARIGDVIMLSRNGLMVIPKEKAAKYMSAKGPATIKKEDRKNDEH